MQSQYVNEIINITTYKNLSHAWTYISVAGKQTSLEENAEITKHKFRSEETLAG